MNATRLRTDEKGTALVIAILVLLVVAMLSVGLMMTVNMGRRVAGHDLRKADALNVAESGVGEATSRIRHGDTNLDPANPRSVSQIFLTNPGSVPVLGADSIGLATSQPPGNWLDYSAPDRGPNVLTVEFKTTADRSTIYRYDALAGQKINLTTGLPIYKITSTGMVGSAKSTVVTEVIQKPFFANAKGALAAGHDLQFIGNAVVCGYNHSADTPNDAGKNKRGFPPDCIPYETGSGDLPGGWSTGAITGGGAAYQNGQPSALMANQTGFYAGPWEALGMSQAEFLSWIGSPLSGTPADLHGVYYLDNNSIVGDQSATIGIQSGDGEGLLYVDGDLTINAQFYYRGLIYVEGNLTMNGQAWVLGGIIVKGRSTVMQNGGATILYSSDAITRALAKFGGQFVTVSWREL
jgi:hypothetical protein